MIINTYQRIVRGMVFWFNLNDKVDKMTNPTVTVNGKIFSDHRQYGSRHWLVVSNNEGNANSPTCTIVPITAQTSKNNIPTHVKFYYQGKQLEILCEQVQTVNNVQLQSYAFVLNNVVMDKVENALRIQLGIKEKYADTETSKSLEAIENIIDNIIREKVRNHTRDIDDVNIAEVVNRISKNLNKEFNRSNFNLKGNSKRVNNNSYTSTTEIAENNTDNYSEPMSNDIMFVTPDISDNNYNSIAKMAEVEPAPAKPNTSNGEELETQKELASAKHLSQTEKFYQRYPNARPKKVLNNSTPNETLDGDKKGKRVNNKWTLEMMEEFVEDVKSKKLTEEEMIAKWKTPSYKTLVYHIKNRISKIKNEESRTK